MRTLAKALLAMAVPMMLLTAVSAAEAAPAPAEVHCTSFSNLGVSWAGPQYFMHVPSTYANSYNYNCVVARGDHNLAVLVVQESLNACYRQGLATDSDFGPKTEQGVRNAQTAIRNVFGNVLTVDGRFGPITSSYAQFQIYDHSAGGAHTGDCAYR